MSQRELTRNMTELTWQSVCRTTFRQNSKEFHICHIIILITTWKEETIMTSFVNGISSTCTWKKDKFWSIKRVAAIASTWATHNYATEYATNCLRLKFIHKLYYITTSCSISTNPPSCKKENLTKKIQIKSSNENIATCDR